MTLALSVLDQSPVPAGGSAAVALRDTVRFARAIDTLGYTRFWVAEHHGSASFAGLAPEILTAVLLEQTQHMRIGTGGVLLPRYDARKVAEVFHVLADLHPGRVDLGIGRAGGPANTFPDQLDILSGALEALRAERPAGSDPEVWLLGSGTRSGKLAADRSLRFCFGHFLNPAQTAPALSEFHRQGNHGRAALAVRVFVAETTSAAQAQARSYLLWRSRKDLGADEPLPSPTDAARHRWTPAERIHAAANQAAIVVGDPVEAYDQLTALAKLHEVDEIVVNTLAHNPDDRILAYRLLAEAFASR